MKRTQNFYFRSSVFVILSLVGAALTYAIYPVLAHIFSLQQLGDYIAIVGLSNQILGILLAFSVISVALVKQYGERESHQKASVIQKILLWLFVIVSAAVLLSSSLLQHLFKIQSVSSFFILSLIMVLAIPSNIWVGYLQGHKEQIRVGFFSAASGLLKFILIIVLAGFGGVTGGLWGLFLGSLLGLFVIYFMPGRKVPSLNNLFKPLAENERRFLRSYRGYVLQAVFVVAGLTFLQNYDLNRAKILFSPQQAGVYGAISIFSNALYFVLFLLVWVLLPEFSLENPKNNRRVLRTAYIVIALMTAVMVMGGLGLGDRLLPVILGPSFAGQAHLLVVASLYQITLVSIVLYAFYLLVLRKRRSLVLATCVLASCIIVPLRFTDSPYQMIVSLLASLFVGLGIYSLLMVCHQAFSDNRN